MLTWLMMGRFSMTLSCMAEVMMSSFSLPTMKWNPWLSILKPEGFDFGEVYLLEEVVGTLTLDRLVVLETSQLSLGGHSLLDALDVLGLFQHLLYHLLPHPGHSKELSWPASLNSYYKPTFRHT